MSECCQELLTIIEKCNKDVRPDPNAAPLMCRAELNKVRLKSDFGATADSYAVPGSNETELRSVLW